MIGGVIGSFLPVIPGPLVSILGISVYFWSTGYSSPHPVIFSVIVLTGIFALGLDYLAGYIGANQSDASRKTAIAAGIASFLLFFVSGPVGILIGTGLTVLLRELMLGKEFEEASRSAVYTTVAMLASVFAKVGLTLLMLLIFVVSMLI
jgi:uncharacterized protein YqgC (DUF456 family)